MGGGGRGKMVEGLTEGETFSKGRGGMYATTTEWGKITFLIVLILSPPYNVTCIGVAIVG